MDNGYHISWTLLDHTLVFSVMLMVLCHVTIAEPPAVLIFGDSTVDVGTNSFLPKTQVRADFPHYGIDFPHSKPTGRFSNGLNAADFLAKLMGQKYSPPSFSSVAGNLYLQKNVFRGLNFASAGSGLFDHTGSTLGVVPLFQQIEQFTDVQINLTSLWGSAEAEAVLCKSVFLISAGSNDIFEYFTSNSTMPAEEFISFLINVYESHLRTLYGLGARKFGIISLAPLGCCPLQRLINQTGGCFEPANGLARAFYSAVSQRLNYLSSQLYGMTYSLGNTYQILIDVIQDPLPFNLKNVEAACCGFGKLNAELPCNATANLCLDRSDYLFWDQVHPTQAASRVAAATLYNGPLKYVSPITLAQLANDN